MTAQTRTPTPRSGRSDSESFEARTSAMTTRVSESLRWLDARAHDDARQDDREARLPRLRHR